MSMQKMSAGEEGVVRLASAKKKVSRLLVLLLWNLIKEGEDVLESS